MEASATEQDFGFRRVGVDGVLTGTYSRLPRVSSGLGLFKESFDSEEVGDERSLVDSRHGFRYVTGEYETELEIGAYDELFLGLLGQSNWSYSNGSSSQSLTVRVLPAASPGVTMLWALSGATFPQFYVGESVSITSEDSRYTGETLVVGINSLRTVLFINDTLPNSSSVTITVRGTSKFATVSTSKVRFAIERANRDLSPPLYQLFPETYVNSFDLGVEPLTIAGVRWGFVGTDATGLVETTPNTYSAGLAYSENRTYLPLDCSTGFLLATAGGITKSVGLITEVSFTVDNDLSGTSVVGASVAPSITWGASQVIAGKILVLMSDAEMYNRFDASSEFSLLLRLEEEGGVFEESAGFTFVFPRCKLTVAEVAEDSGEANILMFEFQALRPRSAVSGFPQSQMVVFITTNEVLGTRRRVTGDGDVRVTGTGDVRVHRVL